MKGLPFLTFTKMHALGNDFILIDEKAGELHQASKIAESNRSKLVTFLCKPHFGIGADGVLFMSEPTNPKAAILKYRYFNSDGSEAQMCGNGIRCFSKYAFTRGYIPKGVSKFCLETNVGLKEVEILLDGKGEENNEVIKIDMGLAEFAMGKIPMIGDPIKEFIREELRVGSQVLLKSLSVVNVGNPHAIIDVPIETDLKSIPLAKLGPELETHERFPEKINVHFMKVDLTKPAIKEFWMRTWERGVGLTMACGTGAIACAALCAKLGKVKPGESVIAHLEGGDLTVQISDYKKSSLLLSI